MFVITKYHRNANQNHNEISPHTNRTAIIKKKKIINVGEDEV